MTGPVASPVFRLRCAWRDARDGASGAGPDSVRRRNLRIAIDALATTVLIALLVSSAWLMIVPTGDQPILAPVESATGIGPTRFLGAGERDAYESAARDAVRFQREVDRLNELGKAARYQGAPLSDDEARRIASYQKIFNEMTRGERFVQEPCARKRKRARDGSSACPGCSSRSRDCCGSPPALEGF